MTKVVLPSRIIVTLDFYEKYIHNNYNYLLKLMRININSKQHKRNHVKISLKDFNEILNKYPKSKENADLIMAAVKRVSEPYEYIEDHIERVIKYAILLSSETPFNTLIFCTADEESNFRENKHFKSMTRLNLVIGEDAFIIIDDFFEMVMDKDYY